MKIKIRYILILSLVFVFSTVCAQDIVSIRPTHKNYVSFVGKIKKAESDCQVLVLFRSVGTISLSSNITRAFLLDKNGNFKFYISDVNTVGNLKIFANGVSLYEGLVSPQDRINIDVIFDAYANKNICKFSGNGSAKYNCAYKLGEIDYGSVHKQKQGGDRQSTIYFTYKAIKDKRLKVLAQYIKVVPKFEYDIIKSNILGEYYRMSLFNAYGIEKSIGVSEKIYDEDFLNFLKMNIETTIATFGDKYIDAWFLKIIAQINRQNKKTDFNNVYSYISNLKAGKLNSYLQAYAVMTAKDVGGFLEEENGGVDPDFYLTAVNNTLNAIAGDKELTKEITKIKDRQTKGAPAFNFQLPADSSGKIIKLSDLRGKVVLIDCWGYMCTGCYKFANVFHKKIYPLFKDNPEFKVVSIMLDESADMNKYLKRLRGELDYTKNPYRYTFPEHINLYGGIGNESARAMQDWYSPNNASYILLIDRNGKIFSSTVPFCTTEGSPNVQRLVDLINEALQSK